MAVSSERLCEIEQLLYQWLTRPTATKSAQFEVFRWKTSIRFQVRTPKSAKVDFLSHESFLYLAR